MEKKLTLLGDTDIHDPSPTTPWTPERHRTLTLVFAQERSLERSTPPWWTDERLCGVRTACTAGSRELRPSSPRPSAFIALGHNGNLVNTEELAVDAGMLPGTVTSDSDLVADGPAGAARLQ